MTRTATVAGGCFWCIEAAMKELDGVQSATSGYAGGSVAEPTYEEVSTGETGHAEAVQVEYDPAIIAYEGLLAVFFTIHDPTTRNRQGPDVGSQYRSAIFTHDEGQREAAERFIRDLEREDAYDGSTIVTEIEPLEAFHEAEAYHQDYYEKHPNDRYCSVYAEPKVEKVREEFVD
ncbi:peptide-methionine (S)-S-oxide reductase MsrA [Halanaeroarchaeum sulfurireducens]|uniref:Peptide methionine sulfoxide reductase MsrA n=1 Tax=Halanaeroarchaeum sulfurireducens TaxID=1604004 RepID=A0A0F7P987_9EURY|nr:peptide-methionine (S)-S-oxide reductase MsrA [Halanaeroarchaeum sulfurireducens]AKH96760.1 methionine sulfoxide reductase A [Halanaeroarchaeum sulfurireducens]ALG81162.1 methionine sulfoxide reductase A [Halanaeroarchaeum sulfurireducens]